MNEEWKEIVDFPAYEVSSLGRFYGKNRRRIMNGTVSHNGYIHLSLTKDGKMHTVLAHRMVAITFLGDAPAGRPFVHHKNSIRNDNRVENLSWVNHSENSIAAWNKETDTESIANTTQEIFMFS